MRADKLSSLVKVRGRFARSVHLERDFADPAEFHVTDSAVRALAVVQQALAKPTERALSLIGPYGSGKSAFCVHLAHLLRDPKQSSFDIETGMLPVLRVGAREPLGPSLVSALQTTIEASGRTADISDLREQNGDAFGERPSPRAVANLFASAARKLPGGLILVADEFGKFLEYAALHPAESDPFLLQELAEAAARSDQGHPLIVVTVLHQNMEAYARSLTRSQQAEWQKVSERFRQVQLFPSDRERVEMVGRALSSEPSLRKSAAVSEAVTRSCAAYDALGLPPLAPESTWRKWAHKSYPLHPLVLLALPALFRRVGQSHRSLFTFLSADEPHALGSYLRETPFAEGDPPFYTLDRLFDYGATNLAQGSAVSREWAEALEAVDAGEGVLSADATRVLKAVALLGLLREPRLPASASLLAAAFPETAVDEALRELVGRHRAAYRRRTGTYRVWEGGDVDVEGALHAARTRLAHASAVLKVAGDICKAETQIARRHSYVTGTLRSVRLVPCTVPDLAATVSAAEGELQVVLCCATNVTEAAEAENFMEALQEPNLLVSLALETERLREAALDVLAANQVFSEVIELQQDRAARRELSARYVDAQTAFRAEWQRLFTPAAEGGDDRTRFWYQGQSRDIPALTPFLSVMADATYRKAPRLRNELINRKSLSGAGAAGRRSLIDAMLNPSKNTLPHLGMVGFPPERSMYECLLGATKLHVSRDEGRHSFQPPSESSDPAELLPSWQALEALLLDSPNAEPISIQAIYGVLGSAPFGLTEGVLPVLLCAFLRVYDTETTFYREGTFIPEPGIADWELLLRRPENFAVGGCRVTGERQEIVTRLALGLDTDPTVVGVVRALLRMTRGLPDYAHKTRRVSESVSGLRQSLSAAKSPEQLLFVDLPQTLGLTGLHVDDFFHSLNAALKEWSRAFPTLLSESRDTLLEACGMPLGDVGFEQLRAEARALETHLGFAPAPLVPFLRRAALPGDTHTVIDNLLAQVADRPPRTWDDAATERFRTQTRVIGSLFREMVAQSGTLTAPTLVPDEAAERDALTASIRDAMPQDAAPRTMRAALLALLREFSAE